MKDCDTFLMVGSSFPYSEFLPKEGQAKSVQIDIDPAMLSLRYPMDVALTGDAAATLSALLPMLDAKPRGDWRQSIEDEVAASWEEEGKRAHLEANPLNPELFFWEFSRCIPDNAVIAASNELDEHAIMELKRAAAAITLWGIGTRLITAFDQPALGGVYKLSAVQDNRGEWHGRVKRASQKQSIPGLLQVRRSPRGDVIYDELRGGPRAEGEELLVPVFRDGQLLYHSPPLSEISAYRDRGFARFPEGMKRFERPDRWPVTIE